MERITTWENLGVKEETTSYMDLLEAASLNYEVEDQDLYVDYEDSKILVPDRKAIIRKDTQEVYGIVSNKYQICQNREAFDFIDYLDGVTLERAGEVGPMIWMIGRLPEVSVLGDNITPHIIFQNSHDGSCSIKSTICMLRIICQNQFVASFKESPATINIRHNGDLQAKLQSAKETMQGVYEYIKNYDKVANEFATKKITVKKFNQIVEKYFEIPEDVSPRTEENIMMRREQFVKIYKAEDNQNFKGTKWGVINAFSDLITHEEFIRKTKNWEDNRFLYSLNPATMDQFMRLVEAA